MLVCSLESSHLSCWFWFPYKSHILVLSDTQVSNMTWTLSLCVWCVFLVALLALCSSKSQVEPPSHVTLNSHEVVEHVQTKGSSYPPGTDGSATPNLFEKTKEDTNRKGRKKKKVLSNGYPPPTQHQHPHGPSGAVTDACSKCASPVRGIGQHMVSVVSSYSTRGSSEGLSYYYFNVLRYNAHFDRNQSASWIKLSSPRPTHTK